MNGKSILFLFKSGRKARLAEKGPREFFYGFTEMERLGIRAELIEEDDLPPPALNGLAEQLATRLLDLFAGLNAGTLSRLTSRPALEAFNRAAALVAATNAHGLALGALKSLGRIAPPILFLPMGVLPLRHGGTRRRIISHWLKPLSLAPISQAEQDWLRRQLGNAADSAYLPFGVDTAFWTPSAAKPQGDYAFSIGNDPHRDWATLAASWSSSLPPLKIVTRRQVPASEGRIEVVAGDWNNRPLSDIEVRQSYRESRFVVLPLRETIQPSGQSACLQAMACGKAVILSEIAGLWDSELLKDGKTCLLVPAGEPAALARAAQRLSEDPELARRLGKAARDIVAKRFSIERMGEMMAARLHALTAQDRAANV